jgi:hypothetical protein
MFTAIAAQTMINVSTSLRSGVMSEASQILIDQALELTAAERAIVAEQILLSLDRPDAKIDAVWVSETEARIDAHDRGKLESVPAGDVLVGYEAE